MLLDDPVHDPRVRQHLPDTRLADLVTASRLGELDSRPLINVSHNSEINTAALTVSRGH